MENVRGKNTRRKHLSKNKKKSWRKVDIQDIEEFLEDERLQERTGGKVAEKTDASLYFVDKKTSKPKPDEKLSRKRKAQERLMDIEVGLKPPPPKKKDRRAPAVLEKEAAGVVSAKHQQAIDQRQIAKKERDQRVLNRCRLPVATFDLWGDKLALETAGEDAHFLQVTKKRRVKVPDRLHRPVSLVPAVEVPHPGTSYNPAYDEYLDLLNKAHSKEVKKLKVEERIRRTLDEKFPKAKDAPNEKTRLEEMSEGLFADKDEEAVNEDLDLDKLSVNPPTRRENKKDERKRKKEKALKKKAKLAVKEKQQRIRDNSIFRLKSIKSEIKEKEKVLQERAEKRAAKKATEMYRTKKLSKTRFEEPDLPVKLSDELVRSLREMKPEGNLLIDRFQSLMKRNILEVRGTKIKKQKRKFKPKVFEKKSHREIK